MNFLSHFYFDRNCNDAYHVLGSVMPDLLRNADKEAKIKIEHLPAQQNMAITSIISGWKKHLEIDLHFHSSDFFKFHAHQLKLLFVPALAGSEVKPFFLGHIALELILDNLLLTNHTVFADDFYDHLKNAETDCICTFLELNHVHPQQFLNFYASFIRKKYLYSYMQLDSVVHALKGICLRIWQNPFTQSQEAAVAKVVKYYTEILSVNFMLIFDEMEALLIET
ncbi:MAG: ACP phosphodiesterase [Janthinobacterium lividum]